MAETIADLRTKLEKSRRSKARRMNEALYNLRMSSGEQQILWNRQEQSYDKINWNNYKQPPIITFNMLNAINLVFISHLLTIDPKFQVMAATTDNPDLEAARAAERYLDRIEQLSHHPIQKVAIANLLANTGRAYDFSYPDVTGTADARDIDIRGETLSCFEVCGPPGIADCDEWPWVFIRKTRMKSYVREKYGLDEEVDLNDPDSPGEYDLESMTYKSSSRDDSENTTLNMYFSKNGEYIIFCGDRVLRRTAWPHDFLGITAFDCFPLYGSHWSHCPVDYATPIQKLYNVAKTMWVSGAKHVAMPKMLVPRECEADKEGLETNLGNEIVEYNALSGYKPEYLVGRVGSDLQMILDSLYRDMEACYGIHEYSQGGQPVSHTPTSLYDAVVEKDTSKFKLVTTLWAESWKKVAYKRLRLAQAYLPEEKIFQLIGKNGERDAHSFKVANLSEGFDLEILPGTDTYKSKGAQTQKIMLMLQNKLIAPDPSTGEIPGPVWDALEMGDIKPLQEQLAGAVKQARAENDIIKNLDIEQLVPIQQARAQIQAQMGQMQMQITQMMQMGAQPPPELLQGVQQLSMAAQQADEAYYQLVPRTYPVYDHPTHLKQHQVEVNSVAFMKYPPPIQQVFVEMMKSHIPAAPEAAINAMIPQPQMQQPGQQPQQEAQGGA